MSLMENEPTPWEDINPRTALVRRQEPQTPCLARLQPATSDHFKLELTSCLALVAPVGMTEEARRDWLAIAWGTLQHLPPDLLSRGCAEARKTCDHPAKIVPAILAATAESMRWRRETVSEACRPSERLSSPDYCSPEEARKILSEFGFKGIASKAA